MLAKTIDRRTFLKRSGVAAGAGAFASQLPFNMIGVITSYSIHYTKLYDDS